MAGRRDAGEVLHLLRSRGPLPPGKLAAALGVSTPSARSLVASLGVEAVTLGRTRATVVAATRDVRGVGRTVPVFTVDEAGGVHPWVRLHFLSGEGTAVVHPEGAIALHAGVPWFLDDLRPQGFLGRAFLRNHPELRLPPLTAFQPDDTLRTIALGGDDLWGHLLVGDAAVERFLSQGGEVSPISVEERARAYPLLAARALAGEVTGSSAGGEQPKFSARIADGERHRDVLVKFSGPVHETAGRRWADLLACEHLALRALSRAGVDAANSELLDAGGRRFLEVERFDRIPPRGRRAVVSLGAADDEFTGRGGRWSEVAEALGAADCMDAEEVRTIARIEAFGRLIANTDRHAGNLSVRWDPAGPTFRPAPVYDMLPMAFAPTSQGEVVDRPPQRPVADPTVLAVWNPMREVAASYWRDVLASPLVSAAFKERLDVKLLLGDGA